MVLTERQCTILNELVNEYIKHAQPVSSQTLQKKKHGLDVCPATVRREMQTLTKQGYLYQPHTSAGRIPTDKGYRFFVNELLKKGISEFEKSFIIEEIFEKEREDIFKFISHLSRFLAENSSALSVIHLLGNDFFWKEGWEELLKEPEFEEKKITFDFTEMVESFEENIENLRLDSDIKIYIGKENPFVKKIKNFSIISVKCCFPQTQKGIVSLLGPKRMAYERNLSLVDSLKKILGVF